MLVSTAHIPPTVRPAEARDASGIALLLSQSGDKATAADVLARLRIFTDGRSDVLVAIDMGAGPDDPIVIGLVACSLTPMIQRRAPFARITAFMVSADRRRERVGSLLLERAEAWAVSRGCDRLEVVAGKRRTTASDPFFGQLGFAGGKGSPYLKDLTPLLAPDRGAEPEVAI